MKIQNFRKIENFPPKLNRQDEGKEENPFQKAKAILQSQILFLPKPQFHSSLRFYHLQVFLFFFFFPSLISNFLFISTFPASSPIQICIQIVFFSFTSLLILF